MLLILSKNTKHLLLPLCLLFALICFCPAKQAYGWQYTVQEADSWEGIALLTHCSVQELQAANPSEDYTLQAGMHLDIPDFISASELCAPAMPVIGYTESELNLLARCVYAEAGAESYEGKLAVAAVVVNRVQSEHFPDTITEVIYEPKQFTCVSNGRINNSSSESCYQAALEALYGRDNTDGALFFYAPSLVRSRYHESLHYICTIGVHVFATDEY